MKKKLEDLDLNLLKLLRVVVETRNTHTAAEKLGISQTSVSRGLAKLRETFGDQLFLRKAHGVEPSQLAENLAAATKIMLDPVIKIVETYQDFDPLTFDSEVSILMHAFILEVHGKEIMAVLQKVLPNAKFKVLNWQEKSLTDTLNGDVDYLIQLDNLHLPQDIYCHTLNETPLSIIARKAHPILSQIYDWKTVQTLPIARVIVEGDNSKLAPIEVFYRSQGFEADIRLVTHSLPLLADNLKKSDMITFSTKYISDYDPDLAYYPLPDTQGAKSSLKLIGGYLQTKRSSPLNQLLHYSIQEFFDHLPTPE